MRRSVIPAEERFLANFERQDGCWPWRGTPKGDGYGVLRVHGRQTRAHRFAYEYFIGPIPSGLHVLHSCDNPGCVNPDHLRVGTHADNMGDVRKRRRQPLAQRTHCSNGHAYADDNAYLRRSGVRGCRKCDCRHAQNYRRRKSAKSTSTPTKGT